MNYSAKTQNPQTIGQNIEIIEKRTEQSIGQTAQQTIGLVQK
jgi:hypothetical protein